MEDLQSQKRIGIDRLVEDMIQESIAKGEFDNLKGSGKPLSYNVNRENPYVDFVTHKMNQVLIDNGFTPAWITLQKEIREKVEELRSRISKERNKLGPLPLSSSDALHWAVSLRLISEEVKALNEKIDNYNLVVPILDKQMFQFNLEKEAQRILSESCEIKQNS